MAARLRAPLTLLGTFLVLGVVLFGLYVLLHDLAPDWADPAIRDPAERAADVGRVRTTVLAVLAGLIAVISATIGALSLRHANRVHRDAQRNEAARRANELYAAAATQLASQHHAVRLAGLYTFERLGQEEPDMRQTVVDVWCAYLRMPPEAGPSEMGMNRRTAHREREVRTATQRLLEQHLVRGPKHWPGLDADLRGANLPALNLSKADMQSLDIREVKVRGTTLLEAAHVRGPVRCTAARFGGRVSLVASEFESTADFSGAEFAAELAASTATFWSDVMFAGAVVATEAWFDACEFHRTANFSSVNFPQAGFRRARFAGRNHHQAKIEVGGNRSGLVLVGGPIFGKAAFDRLDFSGAWFNSMALFDGATVAEEFRGVTGEVRHAGGTPIRVDQLDPRLLWSRPS